VPVQKWPICPVSVLREKLNPRNIVHMPAIAETAMLSVQFHARLDLEQIFHFWMDTKGGLHLSFRDRPSFFSLHKKGRPANQLSRFGKSSCSTIQRGLSFAICKAVSCCSSFHRVFEIPPSDCHPFDTLT
jgi:hypothetical protein